MCLGVALFLSTVLVLEIHVIHFEEFFIGWFFWWFFFPHLTYSFWIPIMQMLDTLRAFASLSYFSSLFFCSTPGRFTQLYRHSLIHTLDKFLLSLYYVKSNVQGAGNTLEENKIPVIINQTVFGPYYWVFGFCYQIFCFQALFVISECSFFKASYFDFWLHYLLLSLWAPDRFLWNFFIPTQFPFPQSCRCFCLYLSY